MRPSSFRRCVTTAAIVIAGALLLPPVASAGWPDAGRPTTTLAGNGEVTSVSGTPYTTWEETSSPNFVSVSSWDGSAWHPVAGPLRADPARRASAPSIADVAGTPWVAFVDAAPSRSEVRVAKRSASGMAWDLQGGALNVAAGASAQEPRIASIGGVPYVAFLEFDQPSNTNKVRVKHWDGAGWVQDGGALNLSSTFTAQNVSIAGVGGIPHVSWLEPVNTSGGPQNQPHVARLNGTTWVTLGTPVIHKPEGTAPRLRSPTTRDHRSWHGVRKPPYGSLAGTAPRGRSSEPIPLPSSSSTWSASRGCRSSSPAESRSSAGAPRTSSTRSCASRTGTAGCGHGLAGR